MTLKQTFWNSLTTTTGVHAKTPTKHPKNRLRTQPAAHFGDLLTTSPHLDRLFFLHTQTGYHTQQQNTGPQELAAEKAGGRTGTYKAAHFGDLPASSDQQNTPQHSNNKTHNINKHITT
jgi:hypothetical protein